MKSDLVDVTMQVHARTAKAIRVSDDGDDKRAVWLPLSQCEVEEKSAGIVIVTLPEWLAIDKGLV
jgi:hypothetical protein